MNPRHHPHPFLSLGAAVLTLPLAVLVVPFMLTFFLSKLIILGFFLVVRRLLLVVGTTEALELRDTVTNLVIDMVSRKVPKDG